MESAVIISFLGANLVAVLALVAKMFIGNRKSNSSGNPNYATMDTKLNSILDCGQETNRKLDTISNTLSRIEGKLD